MIRHAGLKVAVTVVLLTIAVVGLTIGSSLVFVIRFTALPPAGFLTTTTTAIAVATITAATDVENRPTVIGNTESLAKFNVEVLSEAPPHPPPDHAITGWTSRPHHETLITFEWLMAYPSHPLRIRTPTVVPVGVFYFTY